MTVWPLFFAVPFLAARFVVEFDFSTRFFLMPETRQYAAKTLATVLICESTITSSFLKSFTAFVHLVLLL